LFVVDGLWSGIEATDMPVKWKTAPFNNDWPSSLFVAQDQVALESVCLDFLRAEAEVNTYFKNRPFFPAVDDHLHQAADKSNWPTGITYDPEGDGTEISSLGVHEHWNNGTSKQYSRNLSNDGKGIELYSINDTTTYLKTAVNSEILNSNLNIFPNPASAFATVSFNLQSNAHVSLFIINLEGKIVKQMSSEMYFAGANKERINISDMNKGQYICVLQAKSGNKDFIQSLKLTIK
jgi:hypothetical protein